MRKNEAFAFILALIHGGWKWLAFVALVVVLSALTSRWIAAVALGFFITAVIWWHGERVRPDIFN